MDKYKDLSISIKNFIKIPGLHSTDKASKKAGLPPGSLVHVGDKKLQYTVIKLMDYNQERLVEINIDSVNQCLSYKNTDTVTWIEVFGLHDIKVIEDLGREFQIHPLVLEDVLNTKQRPKFEEYETYNYIILKSISYDSETSQLESEQLSIIAGQGYVIVFHETENDLFKLIKQRLNNTKLRIRKKEADYLTYALIDTVVDHYFAVVESLGEKLEELEGVLMKRLDREDLQTIFDLKKNFTDMRKSVWPLQDMLNKILDEEFTLIGESTLLYFRDVRDHVHQVIDVLDTYKEAASNVIDTYLSVMSMRMNEVMKVLTIAATIFLPLTFVAGVYGMNFKYMPELEWRWGYFAILGGMASLFIAMILYFKNKKWL